MKVNDKEQRKYLLGDGFKDVYFTRQEARCMVCLLRGYSFKKIVDTMELEPRTVEYYIHCMRQKLKVKTKFELVLLVAQTSFAEHVKPADLEL